MPTRLKKYDFLEFSLIPRKSKRDVLASGVDFLLENGFPYEELVFHGQDDQDSRVSVYLKTRSQLQKLNQEFAKNLNLRESMQCRHILLEQEDWLDKWKQSYGIMNVGRGFRLVPVWLQKEAKKKKTRKMDLLMDPKGAFGTGMHPTTRIMIQFLEQLASKYDSFFDVGTGSGILAMIASKLGANSIAGLDKDRESIKTAYYNCDLNDLNSHLDFWVGKFGHYRGRKQFDLVGANVITHELIQHQKKLFRCVRKGGYLVVSGISRVNRDLFEARFHPPADFRCVRKVTLGGWLGRVYKRKAA